MDQAEPWKVSQNRSAEDAAGVVQGLLDTGCGDMAAAVATRQKER